MKGCCCKFPFEFDGAEYDECIDEVTLLMLPPTFVLPLSLLLSLISRRSSDMGVTLISLGARDSVVLQRSRSAHRPRSAQIVAIRAFVCH